LDAVFENIPLHAHILVADDNSPDGKADIVEKIQKTYPERLHLLKRPGKQGLAAAYLAAFGWGLSRQYDVFLEIDADFSHKPEYIPAMLAEIAAHDAVTGSRSVPGGGVEDWSFLRKLVSKGGSLYARAVLGCPVQDLTGGFNMWTKTALDRIGLENIISQGYAFQVELKYRAWATGYRIKEIPIIFPDRKRGASKMSKEIFFEALLNIWKIKRDVGKNTAPDQFFKFAVTGGLGTITNLVIFFICADRLGLPEIPASVGCFLVAATQNYIINHIWSFSDKTEKRPPRLKQWLLFLCASSLGLAVKHSGDGVRSFPVCASL
jgi:dolichol-phosphate mannosyltransferase